MPPQRRGRPRAGESESRRALILDAAISELVTSGYEGSTMLAIAKRAGASKETLYAWFGDKDGLFSAMIEDNGRQAAQAVEHALAADTEPVQTITAFAVGLLRLLAGPSAVALNRAAMSSPELARILLAAGRHTIGPIVERYLARIATEKAFAIDNPADAFEVLYGLIVRDTQIRVLLGESPPGPAAITKRAKDAANQFSALYTTRGDTTTRHTQLDSA
jgi:AcrR family transcriptional regulator